MTLHLGAHAMTAQDVSTEQLRRAQERESQLRKQQEVSADVRLQPGLGTAAALMPASETPCFTIRQLQLSSPVDSHFDWLQEQADGHTQLADPDPVVGRCLGAQGVQVVIDRLQNALIARGYVTSRVLAGPQNLQSGVLVLTVVPGQIGEIRWAPGAGQRGSRWNTVPARTGDVLNRALRALGRFRASRVQRKSTG